MYSIPCQHCTAPSMIICLYCAPVVNDQSTTFCCFFFFSSLLSDTLCVIIIIIIRTKNSTSYPCIMLFFIPTTLVLQHLMHTILYYQFCDYSSNCYTSHSKAKSDNNIIMHLHQEWILYSCLYCIFFLIIHHQNLILRVPAQSVTRIHVCDPWPPKHYQYYFYNYDNIIIIAMKVQD